jgi:hypothetical protein
MMSGKSGGCTGERITIFMSHVVMKGDDVDALSAKAFEHGLPNGKIIGQVHFVYQLHPRGKRFRQTSRYD